MLAQNKELKRLKKDQEKRKVEDAKERVMEDAEASERAMADFEKVQAGLSARSQGLGERIVGRRNGKITVEEDVEGGNKGVKRKLDLDEDELVGLAEQQSSQPKKRMRAKDGATELPAFWMPSQIPENQRADIKALKQHPKCPAGDSSGENGHDFTLKTLITVRFREEKAPAGSDAPIRSCPSCSKTLSNTTKAVLAKPCGHVVCKACSDKFQKPVEKSAHDKVGDAEGTMRCYACQEDVTTGRRLKKKSKKEGDDGAEKESKTERGLVELITEGTGFAGGGKNMVKREGVAFQC